LPEADRFFEDPRWRQITELIYVPHEQAYDEVFKNGKWEQCWFVYDEDDDCHRWERVDFYDPKNPFKVGSRNGGLDNNPQSDVAGDRGEWDLDFSGNGDMYIAPFDGRIHLHGAELGYWRIDQFAYYYQGWQGWRGPSIAPEDLVFTEPEVFATVKYTDTDNNGFMDQIEYDLDGDTLFEETVRLKDLGIDDAVTLIKTSELSYADYNRIYSEMSDGLWNNALKAVEVAGKYNLNTSWYAYMMHPKTSREKYSYGFWTPFYVPGSVAATLVLHNAKIWTGNPDQPEASALAVRNHEIVLVGSDKEAFACADRKTQLIDLEGHRVVPGFIENKVPDRSVSRSLIVSISLNPDYFCENRSNNIVSRLSLRRPVIKFVGLTLQIPFAWFIQKCRYILNLYRRFAGHFPCQFHLAGTWK